MNQDLEFARQTLESGGYTCVLRGWGRSITDRRRGVKPLMELLEQGTDLAGFSAADKVVGKAAAMLYCLLKVKAVHAQVISIPARQTLERQGIALTFETQVEAIANRDKTGFCPMETAVLPLEDPAQAPAAIRRKLAELAGGNK